MNFSLEITEGKSAGYRKTITKPERVLIGRDNACDVIIADPLLSRQHCLVEFTPQQIKVIDLKSRNGTYVNGVRIEEKVIALTDKIKVGKHTIELSSVDQGSTFLESVIGSCVQCGRKISEQDIRNMKAVKHGPNLFCEVCLNAGIELTPVSKSQPITRSDIPIVRPKDARGVSIATIADFSAPSSIEPIRKEAPKPVLPPGTPLRIGHYEVLEVLGEGGMGFVYKAKHAFLETIVAIKVIKEELASQPDILKRFLQEAKVGIALDHPNIVRIHDAGESEGVFFISMEFFEGKDLAGVVKENGPLPYKQALKLSLQMANALSYAHKQGVIHRDVKPSNILLNTQGQVKLVDFGLAKAWQKAGAHQLTASGQMLGTIQYISPEQLESSRTVDPRTDIFSLGASIYYLLAGVPPFGQEPIGRVIQNILHNDPPSLRQQKPEIPEALEDALMKSLSKKNSDRFNTTEDFYHCLLKIDQSG